MKRSGVHVCHARGCSVPVKPEFLMCFHHWRVVPTPLKKAVWRHYREGQCDDMRPSDDWKKAAQAAIDFVYHREHPEAQSDPYGLMEAPHD